MLPRTKVCGFRLALEVGEFVQRAMASRRVLWTEE
jgi:hypothetical protein